MKKFAAVTMLLVSLLFGSATARSQKQKPADFANRFYRTYLELGVRGLPDEKELKSLAPYLTDDLRRLFERAQRRQRRFVRENSPDAKPPWTDGDLFTSLFEGAQTFKIGAAKTRGARTEVSVALQRRENGEIVQWTDALVLIETKKGWRVDNILLKGD
jgi:hypothetical protein